jgi:GDP-D-mannose 3', 5'-epimerase
MTVVARRRQLPCPARWPTPSPRSIGLWGDDEQTRSFCYVEDCVKGIYQLMQSNYPPPLYPGTEDMMSINQLARLLIEASVTPDITIRHIDRLQGIRGRNSDNSRLRWMLGWEPAIALEV